MLRFKNITLLTVILAIGLLVLDYYMALPFFLYLLLILFWLVITTIGSFNITWNYHVKVFNKNSYCKNKWVAITFDDGPNSEITPKILQLLEAYKAKATFFCIGKHVEAQPDLVKRIIELGHTVGNHTYSHSSSTGFYSKQAIIDEIAKTDDLILQCIGKKSNLFRPPFGVTNPAISKAIATTKHHVIGWNIRSLDTVKKDPKKVLKRITKRIKPGAVILLHDSKKITVSVLEQLLLFLQENGYQSVTVDMLFNIEAYA